MIVYYFFSGKNGGVSEATKEPLFIHHNIEIFV